MLDSRYVSAPRGLLKMLVLYLSSKRLVNGVELSRMVAKLTEDEWKPSPGSIYYLLNELEAKGLLSRITAEDSTTHRYIASHNGLNELSSFVKASRDVLRKQLVLASVTARMGERIFEHKLIELMELSIPLCDKAQEETIQILEKSLENLKNLKAERQVCINTDRN